jgi:transcriptional antiterminator RfaH
MPILSPETSVFPETLLDDPRPDCLDGRCWWAFHTKPRQEKSLARDLCDRQLSFYLPLIARPKILRGRTFRPQLPLFPGYLFLLGSDQERIAALATGRVVRSLTVVDQDRLWHDLSQLRRLIATGGAITPEQRLLPGMTVEILSGAMVGMRGKVLRLATGRRFFISVDFMKQGASVLLDEFTEVRVVPENESAPAP